MIDIKNISESPVKISMETAQILVRFSAGYETDLDEGKFLHSPTVPFPKKAKRMRYRKILEGQFYWSEWHNI